MEEKRKGRQTPTVGYTLAYKDTNGKEAVEIYERTQRECMEWQQGLLYDMLAVNDDGLWTHTKFGFSVPRQNGKNEVIAMREMYGLAKGERILHTAHRTSTTHTAWERLLYLLEKANIDIDSSFRAFGKEHIYTASGGRIEFRTRTSVGGLGETFDTLIIDEAQEYQDDQDSALKYTIVSSENPQTIYLGTPPTPYSSGTIFPNLRKQILCGEKKNSGWAEWSVEEETKCDNVDAWYETNPSLGYKLTERAIEDEIGGDSIDFNIQRLGLWITYNQKSAISKTEWNDLEVSELPKLKGMLSVGVKFNKDGSSASMAIGCKTDDEKIFVEAIGCHSMRDGVDWLLVFLKKLEGNYSEVIVDGANGFDILSNAMKDAGLKKPNQPSVKEYIQANAQFEQMIFNQSLIHMSQPALEQIVTNCEKRAIGSSGGFGYKAIKMNADVSILDAVILASFGSTRQKEKKIQKVSY